MGDLHRNQDAELDPEGCMRLANAVVILTAKDYRKALKSLKKNPRSRVAMEKAMECERFFDGDWIKVLTSIDGQWLKEKLREEARDNDGEGIS